MKVQLLHAIWGLILLPPTSTAPPHPLLQASSPDPILTNIVSDMESETKDARLDASFHTAPCCCHDTRASALSYNDEDVLNLLIS